MHCLCQPVEVSEPVGNCSIFDVKVFEDEKGDAAKSDLSVVRLAIYCCDRVKVNRGDKRDPFVDKRREISNDSSRRFFLSVH